MTTDTMPGNRTLAIIATVLALSACPAVPPTGPGGRRPDGPKTGHALTFILDHLNRADQPQEEPATVSEIVADSRKKISKPQYYGVGSF